MSDRPDNQDATYLPERYRQQVQAKKQRRIYKKMVTAGLVLVVVIAAVLLLSGMLTTPQPPTPVKIPVTPTPIASAQTLAPVVNVTVAVANTPGYATGAGISALQSPDVLPLDKALALLENEYPAKTHTLIEANLTDRYAGLMLYEFTIQPVDRSSAGSQSVVLYDAVTGDPYTPGQETAPVTAQQAQELAGKAFPAIQTDLLKVRYRAGSDSNSDGTWNFTLGKGTNPALTGTLDAETGQIISFTRPVQKLDRPAEPVLDMAAAQKIADRYISSQNGPVEVNMSRGTYSPLGIPSDPVAGQYTFIYNRIVNNIPCESDGFVVEVNSATGEITAYERHWTSSDNAFSVASEPLVLKREATFSVLQRAKETSPESVDGLRILSAEIKWMDQHPAGVIPRPGSIPLAWKVTFDDDSIRSNGSAQPAVAWVEAQTGSILNFMYLH
ncbi:MAG: hypothetical protein Q7T80_04470 [Methanoregula sp.]|nr:hypothetical protein [Methanoregula sp.]